MEYTKLPKRPTLNGSIVSLQLERPKSAFAYIKTVLCALKNRVLGICKPHSRPNWDSESLRTCKDIETVSVNLYILHMYTQFSV